MQRINLVLVWSLSALLLASVVGVVMAAPGCLTVIPRYVHTVTCPRLASTYWGITKDNEPVGFSGAPSGWRVVPRYGAPSALAVNGIASTSYPVAVGVVSSDPVTLDLYPPPGAAPGRYHVTFKTSNLDLNHPHADVLAVWFSL